MKFPPGPKYKRIVLSGFDVFTLPAPGTNGTGMRNANPSAAIVLTMDGARAVQPDGTILVTEAYILPVSYGPFMLGMPEDTLGPFYADMGPDRIIASISISQAGGSVFNLEMWNSRFHGPSAGNDGIALCPSAGGQRLPQADECQVYPVERWQGYNPKPWRRDFPPQFNTSTLPIAKMIEANTGFGVPRPPGTTAIFPSAFNVAWHVNYTKFVGPCDADTGTTNTATQQVNTNTLVFPPPTNPVPPQPGECARSGGGGDYLSNEIAYRNNNLRDIFAGKACVVPGGLCIPAGHIHTPGINVFGTAPPPGSPLPYTTPTFEAWRSAIVQQARNLVYVVGRNHGPQPPLPGQPAN
jgi:hypothetical protein